MHPEFLNTPKSAVIPRVVVTPPPPDRCYEKHVVERAAAKRKPGYIEEVLKRARVADNGQLCLKAEDVEYFRTNFHDVVPPPSNHPQAANPTPLVLAARRLAAMAETHLDVVFQERYRGELAKLEAECTDCQRSALHRKWAAALEAALKENPVTVSRAECGCPLCKNYTEPPKWLAEPPKSE